MAIQARRGQELALLAKPLKTKALFRELAAGCASGWDGAVRDLKVAKSTALCRRRAVAGRPLEQTKKPAMKGLALCLGL